MRSYQWALTIAAEWDLSTGFTLDVGAYRLVFVLVGPVEKNASCSYPHQHVMAKVKHVSGKSNTLSKAQILRAWTKQFPDRLLEYLEPVRDVAAYKKYCMKSADNSDSYDDIASAIKAMIKDQPL